MTQLSQPLDLRISDYPFSFEFSYIELFNPIKLGKRVVTSLKTYRESLPEDYYIQLSQKYQNNSLVLAFVHDMEVNQPLTNNFLKTCPQGSLGQAYLEYLTSNNLQTLQIQSTTQDQHLLAHKIRYLRTLVHDLEHLLFGLNTTQAGELMLIAINHGAYINEESQFAIHNFKRIPNWIRWCLKLPTSKQIDLLIDYGSHMLPILYAMYSEILMKDIEEVRAQFGIVPIDQVLYPNKQ
jgi:ubiquinone biosynthesis protein Coq4